MNSHPAAFRPLTTRLYVGEPDLLAMYDLLMQARASTSACGTPTAAYAISADCWLRCAAAMKT